ncbi:MAG: DUF5722 domain-containing protein [Eubacteriales bacterium]|nr:DUF5722 domain-containing protein [Eubacteriales bacterium]
MQIRRCLAFLLAVILVVEPETASVMASPVQETIPYEAGMEGESSSEQLAEKTTQNEDMQEVPDTPILTDTPEETEMPQSEEIQEELQEEDSAEDVELSDYPENTSDVEIEEEQEAQAKEHEPAKSVAVDENSFPDENLRKRIQELADTDADGILSQEELETVTSLDLSHQEISSLEGLHYFVNLEELDCSWNHLRREDVQSYMNIKKVVYDNNTYLAEDPDSQVEEFLYLEQDGKPLEETQKDQDALDEGIQESQDASEDEKLETEDIALAPDDAEEIILEDISQQAERPWKFTFVSVVSSEKFEDRVLDETNFPDENFRILLQERYDSDDDGILSVQEQKQITSLSVRESQIEDLTGISFFQNLLLLDCSVNQIQLLNTEELQELRGLYCRENLILELNLTDNAKLKQLECDETVKIIGWKTPVMGMEEQTGAISVGKAAISSLSNPKSEILRVAYKKVSGAKGYDVQAARSKDFKTGLRRTLTAKTTLDVDRMYKDYTYYVRVRAYKVDSAGKRVYGAFSAVKSIKIKSGRIVVNPSSGAAQLNSVSLLSSQTVRVKASVPNYVKSTDGYYYLFTLSSVERKLPASRKPVMKLSKRKSLTFDTPLYRGTKHNKLHWQFAVGVKTGTNQYELISSMKFISNPEKLAVSSRSFPKASTKKGLQVNENYISDAVSLGIKHTTYNMCLDDMIALPSRRNTAQGIAYSYDGATYWFDRGVIESYDRTLNTYKSKNMIVSAIILLRYRSDLTYLMPTPYYHNGFYGLKTSTSEARKQLEAVFTFLAERYAADGRIANWIIGNEVNNFTTYHYTGYKTLSTNARLYTNAFRLAYISIRSVYSKARLYISLDHLWNTLLSTEHTSKAFLNAFAKYWNNYGNFNIAYHPYPSPLTAPEFWKNTNGAISNSSNSACVNMGNISVLTNYVKSKFGSSTRIILSEQGFTSMKGSTDAQKAQAAAIAYAYYLAEFNDMIDAFILHRHIDHQEELNQGLALGLWTRKAGTMEAAGAKKYAWSVYKYVDTSQCEKKTAFAIPIIGKGNWKMIIPGYNSSRFS